MLSSVNIPDACRLQIAECTSLSLSLSLCLPLTRSLVPFALYLYLCRAHLIRVWTLAHSNHVRIRARARAIMNVMCASVCALLGNDSVVLSRSSNAFAKFGSSAGPQCWRRSAMCVHTHMPCQRQQGRGERLRGSDNADRDSATGIECYAANQKLLLLCYLFSEWLVGRSRRCHHLHF